MNKFETLSPTVRYFREDGILLMCRVESHCVHLWSFEIEGEISGVPYVRNAGASEGTPFDKLSDSDDWDLHAGVKWDGCTNWKTNGFAHSCSRSQLLEVGELLAAMFDWAKELIGVEG
jgi:hypothetical protein